MTSDPRAWMKAEDPAMIDGILAAQSTFHEFARYAEQENHRPQPSFEEIAIKAFFPLRGEVSEGVSPSENTRGEVSEGVSPSENTRGEVSEGVTEGEHLFATFVATDGDKIEAILDADPYFLTDLREGDRVTFPLAYLSDWILVIAGRGLGGFTLDPLLRQLPPDTRQQTLAEPPYCWFRERSCRAWEELRALPRCRICAQVDLSNPFQESREGFCRACREACQRCACRDCGAPLFRESHETPQCASCAHENWRPKERPHATVPAPATTPPTPAISPEGQERRASFRLNRIVGAELVQGSQLVKARLFVLDISLTGLRATCHFDLALSDVMELRIFLEPRSLAVVCQARLVWHNSLVQAGTYQYGFQFHQMDLDNQRRLADFIERERRRAINPKAAAGPWIPWTARQENPSAEIVAPSPE